MASLTKEKRKGTTRFRLWVGSEPNRRSVRLGELKERQATMILAHARQLEIAKETATAIDLGTARWIESIGDTLHAQLSQIGLVEPREPLLLIDLIDARIKKMDVAPNTLLRYKQARNKAEQFIGNLPLASITPEMARRFVEQLREKYAPANVNKTAKTIRQFIRQSIRTRPGLSDPFEGFQLGDETNRDRQFFVTQEVAEQVIAEATDAEFRALIALARYAGLRIPSEVIPLKWEHINWERGLMEITDVKCKRTRFVPIFGELHQHLNELWCLVQDSASQNSQIYVIARYRDPKAQHTHAPGKND